MATSTSPNVRQKFKDQVRNLRQQDEGFWKLLTVAPNDTAENEKRREKINGVMKKLCSDANITQKDFKETFNESPMSPSKVGKNRLVVILLELNAEIGNEELQQLKNDLKTQPSADDVDGSGVNLCHSVDNDGIGARAVSNVNGSVNQQLSAEVIVKLTQKVGKLSTDESASFGTKSKSPST